ncbi:tetratricopeptide repeat protein [Aeromonas bestiarum]|uniref:tetratricopeptide repeat protein n=1 Tax=Aeromonas bestiarum TaxID=105751 RepID=UPI0032B1ACD3
MNKKLAVCLGAFLASWLNISHADDSLMKAKALIDKGQEQNNIALLREAVALLEPAVKRGDLSAQFELGRLYADGRYDTRNGPEALSLITAAAEHSNADAQLYLGQTYSGISQGIIEVECDSEVGLKWYEKSAAQGNRHAQYVLGVEYSSDDESIHNDETALKWYLRSAEQGYVYSQEALGKVYLFGRLGQKIDRNKAEHYLKLAAAQGSQDAEGKLRVLRCLDGADPDGDIKALMPLCENEDADRGIELWIGMNCPAAEINSYVSVDTCFNQKPKEDPEANFIRAFTYAFDYGRPVDLAEAYIYFSMAALQSGDERELSVSYRQAIEKALSPAGLTKANKRFEELTNDKG